MYTETARQKREKNRMNNENKRTPTTKKSFTLQCTLVFMYIK